VKRERKCHICECEIDLCGAGEEIAVCGECFDILEYLDKYGWGAQKDNEETITASDVRS